jgi:alpha-aminoadipate/glutamate carrier protein LysW
MPPIAGWSMFVLDKVDVARHQRMKVVPRELRETLFVLPQWRMKSVFVYLTRCNEFRGGTQQMAHCSECEAEITVQGLMIGEIIYCPDCNAELEVLGLEPPTVALAPQLEEDWGE